MRYGGPADDAIVSTGVGGDGVGDEGGERGVVAGDGVVEVLVVL